MLLAALALGPAGCDSDLGEPYPGGVVTGNIVYEGTVADGFAQPVLIVTATVSLDTSGETPPNALLSRALAPEELDGPIPYSLGPLPPGAYYVFALIADGAAFDSATAPRGALPNFCGIAGPDRSITLEQDELAEDADIHVFDDTFDDPFFGGP